jgi:hypothetical protein
VRHAFIVVSQPNGCINHEKHQVCISDGCFNLAANFLIQFISTWKPATCVNNFEFVSQPFSVALVAITGYSGTVLNNCGLLAHNPIEERALSDIWSTDNYNYRQTHFRPQ